MVVLLLIAIIVSSILLWYRLIREGRRGEMAMTYWLDMGSKYRELIDDPSMSSEKWRELLPLFEDADRQYAKAFPYVKDFFHYGEAVRNEIDDLPRQEVGSL